MNKYYLNIILINYNIMSDIKNFDKLTYNLTKSISKIDKKNNGIFFTPLSTIKLNIELLKPYLSSIKTILEPSCGSCQYINYLNNINSNFNITGIEYNKTIYDKIKDLSINNTQIINQDYLISNDVILNENDKFDLIIGNPPYYVMKKKNVNKKYYKYFNGRPNIFILFIIKSLTKLNKNGILSFILPKNFLNCLYYNKTRKFINNNFTILNIIECNDKYIETQQDTILLIIQNNKDIENNNLKNILNINDYIIFGTKENIIKLNNIYKNSTTLNELNCKVSVGNIVWNQCKSILTDDNKKTRLIYNSDIYNNNIILKKYKNETKKNYIDKKGFTSPLLVCNRGYGKGKYIFNFCLIDVNYEYLIENHLICIKYKNNINKDELIKLYNNIIKSFENKKTIEFIKLYFGNNAINTTELNNILPIFN